jgi:CO dehydrogenase/acetyl-CoA synthase epsilon subunit
MKDLDVGKLKQFGDGLTNLSNAMATYGKAVSTIDIVKAEKVKELMKGPSAAEQVANAGAKLFTAAADRISTAVTGSNNQEKTGSDLQALNSTMREMLKYMKDATSNTERTYKVIENKGKVW